MSALADAEPIEAVARPIEAVARPVVAVALVAALALAFAVCPSLSAEPPVGITPVRPR